ncbi:MAG: hypothetical protein WAV25_00275 [Minisyncoccia bacterium]
MINKKAKGYFLIQVLVFGAVAMIVISGLISFSLANSKLSRRSVNSQQAFQIAEAGIEYYRWHLSHAPGDFKDGTNSTGPYVKNFYDKDNNLLGTYTLTITPAAGGGSVTIKSVGTSNADPNAKRIIVSKISTGTGVTFHYGVQSGIGGFIMGGNSTVNGNVYSNGDIIGGNGSSITGNANAVGTITNVTTGTSQTGVLPQDMPVTQAEIDGWKLDAATTTFVGNKTISGSNNNLGPMKIQGNLIINGNATLTVTGTLYVTGTITLGNNVTVNLSSNYGGTGGIVIADGTIELGNDVNLSGSGASGSYLMFISLSTSSLAIDMGNGNAATVMLYAPNGTINVKNNASLRALSAKTINLGNNVDLNYVTGIIDTTFSSGPSGGWSVDSWQEVSS